MSRRGAAAQTWPSALAETGRGRTGDPRQDPRCGAHGVRRARLRQGLGPSHRQRRRRGPGPGPPLLRHQGAGLHRRRRDGLRARPSACPTLLSQGPRRAGASSWPATSSASGRSRPPAIHCWPSCVPRSTTRPLRRSSAASSAATLVQRVAGGLEGPDAEFRVELAMAQLVGIAMLRYVIKVEPMASLPPEELIRRSGPSCSAI